MTDSVARMGKDTKTRWPGIYARHQKDCKIRAGGDRCSGKPTCEPGYIARVWDRSRGKQIVSPTFRTAAAANNWRIDTLAKLARGELPEVRSDLRLGNAVERFIAACREGKALNKHGRRYKPSAIRDLEGALMVHVVPVLGPKRLSDVRRGDVQLLVDDLADLSGSRVRTVVNAIRSLYRWAQDRDMAAHDPAALVRLPAMDATPRDRVATPAEFATLLGALSPADAVAYALAGYATARWQEVRRGQWGDVDLDAGAVLLAADERGRKTLAAQRVVPLVRPLALILRQEWMRQGRPGPDALLCPPRRAGSKTGLLSREALAERAMEAWGWRYDSKAKAWKPDKDRAQLQPIGLHEARHTGASWLNAAGVNPKVASQLMGHSTPERAAAAAAGAAGITLGRYTHTLPGDLEKARELLDGYLAAETAERSDVHAL